MGKRENSFQQLCKFLDHKSTFAKALNRKFNAFTSEEDTSTGHHLSCTKSTEKKGGERVS